MFGKRGLAFVILLSVFVAATVAAQILEAQPANETAPDQPEAQPAAGPIASAQPIATIEGGGNKNIGNLTGGASILNSTLLFPTGNNSQPANESFVLGSLIECLSTAEFELANSSDDDGKKTPICHSTGSKTNPYVVEWVSNSAIDGQGANDHTHHNGDIIPIWDADSDNDIDINDCIAIAENRSCGIVSGTLLYNASGALPNSKVAVNNSLAIPFYTFEPNPSSCGTVYVGYNCSLNWTVNTTGPAGTSWLLAVNATSSKNAVASNLSKPVQINIVGEFIAISLSTSLFNVVWSELDPGTFDNPASNNSNDGYYFSCAVSGGFCNISIKANADLQSGPNSIGISNVTWNKVNANSSSIPLTFSLSVINATMANGANQTLYFWLDVPANQPAGNYTSSFNVRGELN